MRWATTRASTLFTLWPNEDWTMTYLSHLSMVMSLSEGMGSPNECCSSTSLSDSRAASASMGYLSQSCPMYDSALDCAALSAYSRLIFPTSTATSSGTGISSPTQLGTAPV